jgi:hypothetical protein
MKHSSQQTTVAMESRAMRAMESRAMRDTLLDDFYDVAAVFFSPANNN